MTVCAANRSFEQPNLLGVYVHKHLLDPDPVYVCTYEADSIVHRVTNPKAWLFSQFAAANMGTSQSVLHLALHYMPGTLELCPHMAARCSFGDICASARVSRAPHQQPSVSLSKCTLWIGSFNSAHIKLGADVDVPSHRATEGSSALPPEFPSH